MARVNFRVTEVNDLSKDGASNKRVVFESKGSNYDGSGPDPKDPAWAHGPTTDKDAVVDGRLELVVDNATQAKFFPIGSLHPIDFAAIGPEPKQGPYPQAGPYPQTANQPNETSEQYTARMAREAAARQGTPTPLK